jgi:hypothetical protein
MPRPFYLPGRAAPSTFMDKGLDRSQMMPGSDSDEEELCSWKLKLFHYTPRRRLGGEEV